jgi:hypothetical protein
VPFAAGKVIPLLDDWLPPLLNKGERKSGARNVILKKLKAMELIDTFKVHQEEPNKSLLSYLKELRIKLGKGISGHKKIYLDTKFWIIIRDVQLGRTTDKRISQLYHQLYDLSQAEKIICPLSDYLFLEIMKQTDPNTLHATVNIIDDLSKGVSIISTDERIRLELMHMLYKFAYGEREVYPLGELVWTKLAYTLGFVTPANKALSDADQLLIQKVFLDQLWNISLSDIVEKLKPHQINRTSHFRNISEKLNEGKTKYAYQNKSFKQMFMSELAGVIETLKPELERALIYLYQNETDNLPSEKELKSANSGQKLANFIYHAFRLDRLTSELATLKIGAGLHASVRWDRIRKYSDNDIIDFGHAQSALPYCDYFFTEHNLRDLVTRKHLSYDKLFNCKVTSLVEDAIDFLEKEFG